MKKISVLDCTLRDGGYINDWHFGRNAIKGTISSLREARIDIIECGFLDEVEYDPDVSLYSCVSQIAPIIAPKDPDILYVAMIALGDISPDKIMPHDGTSIDGMAWSVLSPLLMLLVMRLVFTQFFGRNMEHYTTYLFCGNLVFSYFSESTGQGMQSLMGNAGIFTKVNVPKYLFLLSKNVQALINFGLTLIVFVLFCALDGITFTWRWVALIYPIALLLLFNIGVGLILSALFVFFRDIQYLWSVFTQLLMYMSAIFYTIDNYSPMVQNLFLLNPVYLFIRYFRKIVIEMTIPSVWFHLLMLVDVVIVLGIGCWMYKKYNHRFLYYV